MIPAKARVQHASYITDFQPDSFLINEAGLTDLKQSSVVRVPRVVSRDMSPFSTGVDKRSEVKT